MARSEIRLFPSALVAIAILLIVASARVYAQTPDPEIGSGVFPFQTYLGEHENINLGSGNLNIQIPVLRLPGRDGHDFVVSYTYNSQVWSMHTFTPPNTQQTIYQWAPPSNPGWQWNVPTLNSDGGVLPNTLTSSGYTCGGNYRLKMWDGRVIYFPAVYSTCLYTNSNGQQSPAPAQENLTGTSGPPFPVVGICAPDRAVLTVNDGNSPFSVKFPSGETLWFTAFGPGGGDTLWKDEDANGNVITYSPGTGGTVVTDTVGRTITIGTNGSGSGTITYPDSSGNQETITLTAQVHTFTTAFPTNLYGEENQQFSWSLLSSIAMPNGDTWTMSYDNGGSTGYGELTKLTYPTGGYTTYQYEFAGDAAGGPGGIGGLRQLTAKQVCRSYQGSCSTTDNTTIAPTFSSNYLYPSNASSQVVDAVGDVTVYNFGGTGGIAGYESSRLIYSGTSTLLKTISTVPTCLGPASETVTLPSGLVSKKTFPGTIGPTTWYGYQTITRPGSGPFITTGQEFDFGNGTPGSLLRQTVVTWLGTNSVNGTDYTAVPIYLSDRKTKVVVEDASNNPISQTTYEYDNYSSTAPHASLVASGAVYQDSAYIASANYLTRGNVTQTQRWLSSNGTWLPTTNQYDDAGNVLKTLDPMNNPTGFSYTDGWGNTACVPSSGHAAAYLTSVTNALSQVTKHTYNSCTGTMDSTTDSNNQVTTYRTSTGSPAYDALGRLTQTNYPDGGKNTICYSDDPGSGCNSSQPQLSTTTTTLITSSPLLNKTSVGLLDGVGNVVKTELTSDSPMDIVDTVYDGVGRKVSVSNPYQTTGDLTYGVTTYQYDGLNRTILVTKQDGSKVVTDYAGNTVTVTDEAGNQRRSVSDGLGRLTEVDEPSTNSASASASATITISGTGIESHTTTGTAASGSGSVTISGTLRCYNYCVNNSCRYLGDAGNVSVTVNNVQETTGYSGGCDSSGQPNAGDTATTIAQRLAGSLTSSSAGVTAVASGGSISITANAKGLITDYPLSATSATASQYFAAGTTSFPATPSGSALTGGQDGPTTTYDSGTVSATIDTCTASVSYSQSTNSTSTALASALASSLSSTCSNLILASANGSVITLTAVDPGAAGNSNTISVTSVSNYPNYFTPPSFTDSSTSFSGGSDGGLGAPLVTQYSYDQLNNLTCAVQKGTDTTQFTTCAAAPTMWRPRSFVYDSLSRLTSASNPESGNITYTYDNDGNVLTKTAPLPNQTLASSTVKTTYTYDTLNRLTLKTYSENGNPDPYTPQVQYGYDGATLSNCTIAPPGDSDPYPVGRETSMCDGSGGTSWTHEKMGRVNQERRAIGKLSVSHYVNYTFNLDGSLKVLQTPPMKNLNYTYNGAGRAIQLVDSTDNINFALNATYAPPGELTGVTLGSASGFAGFAVTNAYNNRLQPILLSATNSSTSATVFSECFDFHSAVAITQPAPCSFSASSLGNNGNVYQVWNNRNNTRNDTYTYDSLNRIASAQSNGTGSTSWGDTYVIDAWGNLTNINPISGKTFGQNFQDAPASVQNQLSNYCNDSAGNLVLNTPCPQPPGTAFTPTYYYDAENRLVWTAGYRYVYDGNGQRVEKCQAATVTTACPTRGTTGTLYWRGTGSNTLAETDLGGNDQEEYLFFNGQRIARRDVSSTGVTVGLHYYFSDQLGSHAVVETVTTSGTTSCDQDIDYYPYGGVEEDYCSGSGVMQNYKFTGKERDTESNLDYFGARHYASTIGRFMVPDWAGSPTDVPYADFGDPQTLNLYGYVRNNPLFRPDIDGHGIDLWQRFKNCFKGFCGFNDKEAKAWQDRVDRRIQTERDQLGRACPKGCLGRTPSEIKSMSQEDLDRFYEAVQDAVQWANIFYGAAGVKSAGSTGRTAPNNLKEQLAMEQVKANPSGTKLPIEMNDPRWPANQGWVKMSETVNGVEIHYVENTATGAVDDFKFK